jgi:predicted ATPase
VIHRDVKPENMLLGRNQEVLLTDFGIAIIAHSSQSQHMERTAGTIAYMAPEQMQGHPGPASDQYALGIVVYEWLTGERPFHGSFPEIASQHLSVSPPPLREKTPKIPQAVEQVILRVLAKDPKERFVSVQDFALTLEEVSKGESSWRTLPMLASHPVEAELASKSNVPAPLTLLIGREQEVAEACALLLRPGVRLVTLTGTGGVGKTRLGLHIATALLGAFADGVCFVSLAPMSDPALVVPTIAAALGIREIGGSILLDLLKAYLRDKCLLLLLDNFEQVVDAAVQVADLLAVCPQLKVLVTSRAALHIRGEQEFVVPPLAVPDPKHLPDLLTLSTYEAVELFLQRIQAVKPEFHLTDANATAVAEMCIRLDGLPLAIELAAARIKLLSPQALLTRLEHRLNLLTGGARDVPERQQTLRNTIEWSYDLLSPGEQLLFRRLAVFVGGCTLEAVEAICTTLDGEATAVLERVTSLVDKSLISQQEQVGGEYRLMMLETIREYGLECLTASGEMETTRRAHAYYYLLLAEEADPELWGHQQSMWFERLEREHENLRAGLNGLL